MNERILIIEDDQAILKILQRGLAYEGYTVDTATEGRSGLMRARVRALLRRTQPDRVPVLKFADLALDTGSRQASRVNRLVQLTAKEYELLEPFSRHPKQVLTREAIFARAWGYDFGGESNVRDVYIR